VDHPKRHLSVVPLTPAPSPEQAFAIADETVVVALSGSLTEASVVPVTAHLVSLVRPGGPREIIIDLRRISSINAAGLRPLVEANLLMQIRSRLLTLGEISCAAHDFLEAHVAFAEALAPLGRGGSS